MDKKKLWLLIGAGVLVVIIVLLCLLIPRRGAAPAASVGEEPQAVKLPVVGLCLRQGEENKAVYQLLETKFTQSGYQVQICDAMNDQTRQNQQIAALLEDGAVLLVIEPVLTDAAGDTVALLKEKNIPGVFINYKPEAALQLWDRVCFVGNADDQLGALQAQVVLDFPYDGDLNEDGLVSCLILSGPEDDTAAQQQVDSCRNALVEAGLLIEEYNTPWGERTLENGRVRCAKALAQYGRDIEVIICGDGDITQGALEALASGGWQIGRDFCFIGADTENVPGVFRNWEEVANQTFAAAQSLLKNEAIEKEYYVNLETVMPETE